MAEDKPESKPFWVKCDDCSHTWSPLSLPMEMRKAAKIMKLHNKCPNCRSKKVFVAKQTNGVLQEPANG
jgi:Zn finger protein HypA/HybF involved in hydrogenase expression